jgi:hypothetical protein
VVRWENDAMTNRDEGSSPDLHGIPRERSREATVFRLHGDATPIGLVTIFREFLADPTPLVLWDMREGSLKPLTIDELRWLVSRLTRANHRKRPTGKSAFVCSDEDYNVVRLLVAYAEANDYAIELAVFTNLEVAERWLFDEPSKNRSE